MRKEPVQPSEFVFPLTEQGSCVQTGTSPEEESAWLYSFLPPRVKIFGSSFENLCAFTHGSFFRLS